MSLAVNHNLMASNVANNLNAHYSKLATSTQRLSTGLRINSAADDAAGLAIRELMRADIAALNQGVRNANDAISMLQTADGALAVIDEKLIRMKVLAEQAATGTYDSTQRMMINNEFLQMASEIDRIARATDFNGIKMLDGDYEKTNVDVEVNITNIEKAIHDNYYSGAEMSVTVGDCKILNSDAVVDETSVSFKSLGYYIDIVSYTGDSNIENYHIGRFAYPYHSGFCESSAVADYYNDNFSIYDN